ncbi:DUF6447 family protein [Pseudoduganella aquatica]|uniref:Uncharacterized protein n=1 Tax=Pseudoduganella aquatica TaxID=2660641 RepID=A0A7X4KNZ3_9BURK|nr:DUF6447 family protein [Pseudoduganella aquatica]MYN09748.1 hypothetical protein [Pseudoduganella aquatica]
MPTITIDNQVYDLDTLPEAAKEQLRSLQFVDGELDRLQAKIAVLRTARSTYARALNEALAPLQAPVQDEILKF